MSIFSRYIDHRTAGLAGVNDLPALDNPLGAGRFTLWSANAQHLLEQNPRRVLRSHAGLRTITASSPLGAITPTTVAGFDWQTISPKLGCGALDLGTHYVWWWTRGGTYGLMPVVTLRLTVQQSGGAELAWCMVVSPPNAGPLDGVISTIDTTTAATWDAKTVTVDLNPGTGGSPAGVLSAAPTNGIAGVAAGERLSLVGFRVFFAAVNSAGSGNCVGLSLSIETPTT